jgi:hypothetical protein
VRASRVRFCRCLFEFEGFYVKWLYPLFFRNLLGFVGFFSVLFAFVFADLC